MIKIRNKYKGNIVNNVGPNAVCNIKSVPRYNTRTFVVVGYFRGCPPAEYVFPFQIIIIIYNRTEQHRVANIALDIAYIIFYTLNRKRVLYHGIIYIYIYIMQ